MADAIITRLAAVGNGPSFSLNTQSTNPTLGLTVIISGTGNYKVQYCAVPKKWVNPAVFPQNSSANTPSYSQIFPTGDYDADMATLGAWIDHPVLLNLTATTASNIVIPTPVIRLVCNSYSSGSALLVVNQGAYPG